MILVKEKTLIVYLYRLGNCGGGGNFDLRAPCTRIVL